MTLVDSLLQRIASRDYVVGIVGLGYVGLPLMRAATDKGFRVLGFDIDQPKVERLNRGISPLRHFPDDQVRAALDQGLFEATADVARMGEADAILICVPTPLGRHREPDLSYISTTLAALAPYLREGQLLALESTTYPGTTRELMRPVVEARGFVSGKDIFLAYSPEREDPGNIDFSTSGIPKVVGGDGPLALQLAQALYDSFVIRTVPVSSTDTAEAVKLTENIFRAVNIALVNELKVVYAAMGIDIWEVIDAAKTKPFGFMPFYPGPGLGGHCIPIDPFYLTWRARAFGISTRFIELAGEINTAMPAYVVGRLAEELDRRFGRGLNGTRILIMGVAYKKNVDDMRESPALALIEMLEARGAITAFHDPFVAEIPPTREHAALAGRRSLPLTGETMAAHDVALIVTDHDGIDYEDLVEGIPLVMDTRNATRHITEPFMRSRIARS